MLSGAYAYLVAVVKSLNMGNHTHTHFQPLWDVSMESHLSILWGAVFVWLPQGFAMLCIQQYSWRATFPEQEWYGQGLDKSLNSTITRTHATKKKETCSCGSEMNHTSPKELFK